MANDDIIQVISDAREDAVSLSQFMYYPATVTVNRRLAPPVHTLNYYLMYLEGLEKVYSQPTGTVEVNGEVVKTVRQSINDAVDSAILGDYQTQLEAELSDEVDRATNRENDIEDALEAEAIRATGAEGAISQDLSELSLEVEAQKLDTGITATAKFGGISRQLDKVLSDDLTTRDFGAICDGTYHPLSSIYTTLDEAKETYPFATSLEQSIDDVALQLAINSLSSSTVVVIGTHVSHQVDTTNADAIIEVVQPDMCVIFEGLLVANNAIKTFLKVSGDNFKLVVNADGRGIGLSTVLSSTGLNTLVENSTFNNLFANQWVVSGLYFHNSGATVRNSTFHNLDSARNGEGDTLGMCRAIVFDLINPTRESKIHDCIFDGAYGDGGSMIAVVAKDASGGYVDSKVVISDNIIRNVNRRHIKIQANKVNILNNYFSQDDSVVLTSVASVVDLTQGSGHIIRGNVFDSINNFTLINIYQPSSSNLNQDNILILDNSMIGLSKTNNTTVGIYLSANGSNYIIKNNLISVGNAISIKIGKTKNLQIISNTFECVESSEAVITLVGSSENSVIKGNTFVGGTRSGSIIQSSTSNVLYLDNTSTLANSGLVRVTSTSSKKALFKGNVVASALVVGTEVTKSNVFLGNHTYNLSSPTIFTEPMYISSPDPAVSLAGVYVTKGQMVYCNYQNVSAGDFIGYVAVNSGLADAIPWRGFGVLN